MSDTPPADMAALREALHHLGEYTGNSGFYTDPDYLAVNAALDELERARERIAALESVLAQMLLYPEHALDCAGTGYDAPACDCVISQARALLAEGETK